MPHNSPIAPDKAARVHPLLQRFAEENTDTRLLLLTSEDGFEVAAHPSADDRTSRIAAMSSSIQALADSLMKEAGLANANDLIVDADAGSIVVMAVRRVAPRMSLAIFTIKNQTMGTLLWAARALTANIEKEILRA